MSEGRGAVGATPERTEIAVLGGGIVGAATALRLAGAGREVLLIDKDMDGVAHATAIGSAGVIANYAVAPLANPATLGQVWSLLTDPESPLALRWRAAPALAPWLARFALNSRDARAKEIVRQMAVLLEPALDDWRALAETAGAPEMIRQDGVIYMFEDPGLETGVRWDNAARALGGVRQEKLGAGALSRLEPALASNHRSGYLFPDAAMVADPAEALTTLRRAARAAGARTLSAEIRRLEKRGPNLALLGRGFEIEADTVILTAGFASREVAASVGDSFPLVCETGYHLEYAPEGRAAALRRPVSVVGAGVYFRPVQAAGGPPRLRVTGDVELSDAPHAPNQDRIDRIDAVTRAYFPDLGPPLSTWMGHRPSFPDGKPAIGRSRRAMGLIHAFGHGHLGVTLAATTARLILEILERRGDAAILASVDPQRWG